MKIFISSLIAGFEHYRSAAQEAVEALGHTVVCAEDFSASPSTPQQACLAAVRSADVVVLLLGERYGTVQISGLSPTHEEYREARDSKPVLAFVESGISPEPEQAAFITEVQGWSAGQFRKSFEDPADLRNLVTRALHDYELGSAVGIADESEMVARVLSLLEEGTGARGVQAQLLIAVVGGPAQQVLRPGVIESSDLAEPLQKAAFFGDYRVLEATAATAVRVRGSALWLEQDERSVLVDEAGSFRIAQPARSEAFGGHAGLSAIIEEDLTARIALALGYIGAGLERVDPQHRVTDVVPAARLIGAEYLPWRTQAEHQASPQSASIGLSGGSAPVMLTPARRHRQALVHDVDRIATDLMTLLRREHRG